MASRLTALLLVALCISITAGGCALPGKARYVAYAVDATVMAAGLSMMIDAGSTECNYDNSGPFVPACQGVKGVGVLAGTTILALGTAGLLGNILLNKKSPKKQDDKPVAASALDFSDHTRTAQAETPTPAAGIGAR